MEGGVIMFCQKCGHENTDDCIYCVSCGENLEGQTEEETIKVSTGSSYKKTDTPHMTGDEHIPHQEEAKTPPPANNSSSDSLNYTKVSTNPLASASLVLGIVALFSCCGAWVPFLGYGCIIIFPLLSLLGLILGIIGRMQIAGSGGAQKGNDIALIGIVMNGLWVLLFIIYIILMVFGVVAATTLPMILDNIK